MKSPLANQSGANVARTPNATRQPGPSVPRASVLDCASPLALSTTRDIQSASGLAQSKTLRQDVRFRGMGLPPDWRLRELAEVGSTNLAAANLPAWHAVRSATQTAGRGRFQRRWVSDAGGLWLSAVVPVETNSPAWRMLPLATGVAVCDALRATGVKQLRLRWPNDVLVGDCKLAGLLIDQFQPGLAVVGIGVNVTNHPEVADRGLSGHIARLADLVSTVPPLGELTWRLLASLASVWLEVRDSGSETILPRVNALWDLPRQVQLELDGTLVSGEFAGVDAGGRLRLRLGDGATKFFDPQDVQLLRDIPRTIP